MNKILEEWVTKKGLEIENWVGSGDFGDAYETTCGKIIKETSDPLEFLAASRMEGKNNTHVVDIYQTDLYKEHMFILMEKLDIDESLIESYFYELQEKADNEGVSIMEIDPDDYEGEISDEALILLDDISSAVMEYQKTGTNPLDIQPANIGRKENGNFALFDQRDKMMDLNYAMEEYKKEKEKKELFSSVSKPKNEDLIKLNFQIKEHDFNEKDDPRYPLLIELVDKINSKKLTINPLITSKHYPDIIQANRDQTITIYITSEDYVMDNFSIQNHNNENRALGCHCVTTGDGQLGETEYMKEHAVMIYLNQDHYKKIVQDLRNYDGVSTDKYDSDYLYSWLNTMTHEIYHAIEFIECSNGLTPHDIEDLVETMDYDYNIFDCSTGYNIREDADALAGDYDAITALMEERVESKGLLLLESCSLSPKLLAQAVNHFSSKIKKSKNTNKP